MRCNYSHTTEREHLASIGVAKIWCEEGHQAKRNKFNGDTDIHKIHEIHAINSDKTIGQSASRPTVYSFWVFNHMELNATVCAALKLPEKLDSR